MKRKGLRIFVILAVSISFLILFLLLTKDSDIQETIGSKVFTNINKISCIRVNDDTQSLEGIEAYENGSKTVEGILYDGGDKETFIYTLIKNGDIITFQHAYADVCLVSESEDSELDILTYKVRQVYFTSKKNVEKYTFSVTIDKNTNQVKVVTPGL